MWWHFAGGDFQNKRDANSPLSFVLHTGDLSHLAQADEFDTLDQVMKSAKTGKIFYVPGEHDVLNDNGKQYLQRYGKDTKGNGWYSFDFNGVHFIGLVNVVDTSEGGLGVLGNEQLQWLENDLKGLSSSTPVVVFAHIPFGPFIRNGGGVQETASKRFRI